MQGFQNPALYLVHRERFRTLGKGVSPAAWGRQRGALGCRADGGSGNRLGPKTVARHRLEIACGDRGNLVNGLLEPAQDCDQSDDGEAGPGGNTHRQIGIRALAPAAGGRCYAISNPAVFIGQRHLRLVLPYRSLHRRTCRAPAVRRQRHRSARHAGSTSALALTPSCQKTHRSFDFELYRRHRVGGAIHRHSPAAAQGFLEIAHGRFDFAFRRQAGEVD